VGATKFPNHFIVDSGDFFGAGGVQDSLKSAFLVDAMNRLGYDVATLGEREFAFGQKFLLDAFKKTKIDLVSANIVYADSRKPFVKPYVIKKVGSVKVAFTGLIYKDAKFRTFPSDPALQVLDPTETAKTLIPELRKKADIVVLLSHLGYVDGQKMTVEVPGIDVMVFGHAAGLFKQVIQTQGVVNVRGGDRGQHIPAIHLVVEDGKISSFDGEVVVLDEKIPADEEMHHLVDAFSDDLNKRFAQQAAQQAQTQAAQTQQVLGGDHYLGEATCRRCHEAEYQKVQDDKHAHAMQTLIDQQRDATPECLVCHVVGLGQAGGFISRQTTPQLANVQCENCHGMGTKHPDGTNTVGPDACLRCHTDSQSPNFDYDEALEHINHWD
jgi:2',3'-cyclic-nucleotide 2'-phosphodiesterase (5'-nucleotidase family)